MEKIIEQIKAEGFPLSWSDPLYVQSCFTLEEKGYLKKVSWGVSSIPEAGIGLFANELIKKGEQIRVYEEGKNAMVFRSERDIPPIEGTYTLKYITDNLFQFNGLCAVFIPFSCCNHSTTPNVKELVALRDIHPGEEILDNYASWGNPPKWLADFADKHAIQLTFEGYNDFV